MGNQQSDQNEDLAFDVIKWIPGVNIAYGFGRSVVYAAKGDTKRAGISAVNAAGTGFATTIGAGFGGPVGGVIGNAVGGAVSDGLSIPIKKMPDRDYKRGKRSVAENVENFQEDVGEIAALSRVGLIPATPNFGYAGRFNSTAYLAGSAVGKPFISTNYLQLSGQ